jgi:hypothetical protein
MNIPSNSMQYAEPQQTSLARKSPFPGKGRTTAKSFRASTLHGGSVPAPPIHNTEPLSVYNNSTLNKYRKCNVRTPGCAPPATCRIVLVRTTMNELARPPPTAFDGAIPRSLFVRSCGVPTYAPGYTIWLYVLSPNARSSVAALAVRT